MVHVSLFWKGATGPGPKEFSCEYPQQSLWGNYTCTILDGGAIFHHACRHACRTAKTFQDYATNTFYNTSHHSISMLPDKTYSGMSTCMYIHVYLTAWRFVLEARGEGAWRDVLNNWLLFLENGLHFFELLTTNRSCTLI